MTREQRMGGRILRPPPPSPTPFELHPQNDIIIVNEAHSTPFEASFNSHPPPELQYLMMMLRASYAQDEEEEVHVQ